MKRVAEKLATYIVNSKKSSEEDFIIYMYGMQIGIEIILCMIVSFGISIYLHCFFEFMLFISIFVLLRTYVGGLHFEKFGICFLCSNIVQVGILFMNKVYQFPLIISWSIIVIGGMLLGITAHIENVNRMLDLDAKRYCRKNLSKILIGLVVFIGFLTLFGKDKYISLVAYTLLVVVSSAALGIVKFNIEKRKLKNID